MNKLEEKALEIKKELRKAKARKYYHDNAEEINRKRYAKNKKKKQQVIKKVVKKVKKRRKYRRKPILNNVRITYSNGTSESFRILHKVVEKQLLKFLIVKEREALQAERESKRCPTCGRLPK